MKALEVWINGEKKCVAGTSGNVLHATVSASVQPNVRVGGVTYKEDTSFHAQWLLQNLQLGDEVTIRVTETDEVDAPEEETRFQTQTERDEEIRSHLLECRNQIPATVQQSDSSTLELFIERLQQDNFVGAMHALADLGREHEMKAPYWASLMDCARLLSRYDESRQYAARYHELKENEEDTS